MLGPLDSAEQRDSVSLALLVLLERLTPAERAVFVLREAFAYPHREIASLLGLSETNSRQLHRRARQAVTGHRPVRAAAPPQTWRPLVADFLAAARDGDLARLEEFLAAEAVSYADGGGVVGAARRPVVGRDKVARYFAVGLAGFGAAAQLVPTEVNAGPGLLALVSGRLAAVIALDVDVEADRICAVRVVLAPDKLAFAGRQLSPGDTARLC